MVAAEAVRPAPANDRQRQVAKLRAKEEEDRKARTQEAAKKKESKKGLPPLAQNR